jgi:N-acetylglucosaminyl-diphospho-decaprenol L-rhamnosyltransferase
MTSHRVDVVVVTIGEHVLQCLEHLTDPSIEQAIVVVNGSHDGTVEAIEKGFPSVTIVSLPHAEGLPFAENRGAERGSTELILFLNDDVLPAERAISLLAEALAADPTAVAAGGRLVNQDDLETQEQYRPRSFPSLGVVALQLLDVERVWPSNPVTRRHWGAHLDDERTVAVAQPAGACLMVKREAFEAIGGFDEGYWIWYEDTDLVRRLSSHGRALYVPGAVFRHFGAGSVWRLSSAETVLIRYHGLLRYCQHHFSSPSRRGLGALLLLIALPRIAVFAWWRPDMAVAYRRLVRSAVALVCGKPVPALVQR